MREPDLAQIRVFPRAQWLNLARGNFSITEVAERMRALVQSVEESPFLSKIEGIRARLQQEDDGLGAVLLIGVGENDPLTILDGVIAWWRPCWRLQEECKSFASFADCRPR